jgi:hypothetical protein
MPPKYEKLKAVATEVLADNATYWQHLDNCVPGHYLSVTYEVDHLSGPETRALFQRHGWTTKDNVGIVSADGRYGMEYGSSNGDGDDPAFIFVTLSYTCCSQYRTWRWLVP